MKRHISTILLILLCLTPVSVRYWIQETYGAEICRDNDFCYEDIGYLARMNPAVLGSGGSAADCNDCTGKLACQNWESCADCSSGTCAAMANGAHCTFDNSEDWYAVLTGTGAVDASDTTSPILRGTKQLELAPQNGSGVAQLYHTISATGEVWGHFLYYVADATPSSSETIFTLQVSTTAKFTLINTTLGKVQVLNGTSSSTSGSAVFSDATKHHVWIYYKKATESGNDGIATVWVGTTTTRPESSSATVTNGNTTSSDDVTRVYAKSLYNTSFIDQIILDDAEFTTVCE